MPQTIQVQTSLMSGGLDLATPPIAMPPGKAIAAVNYEPDVSGYTSFGGYERYDGKPRPSNSSDPVTIASRRSFIQAVPGTGPVRGVWVYNDDVYAFRDQDDGFAGMFKATPGGWVQQIFGQRLEYVDGGPTFIEGEYIAGGTSAAVGFIDRLVLREGVWDGTAAGYMIVSKVIGTFVVGEALTSGSGGVAEAVVARPIRILPGGRYDFTNHNFYGATSRSRMYFANAVDTAFEWNGTTLVPIHTGITGGGSVNVVNLLAYNNDTILAYNGDQIIMSASFDAPSFISHYKNHLFLGFTSGSLINSSLGEPLEYVTVTGAGEIAFGQQITGLLTAASSSLVIFAENRIEYLTGEDSTTFVLQPISDASGAKEFTVQMMDAPMFMDDGGIRSLPTTPAFGDWRMSSVTQAVERLMRQKRDEGIQPVASMRIKAKDQYRLFWNDGTGITVYIGRKYPETLPFKLPVQVYCACTGEVNLGFGDRLFVGCQDGFVYEMNRGTSYDGLPINSYIRLPFTAAGSPMQMTRWMKATFELDTPDDLTIGVAFDVDYAKGLGGTQTNVAVEAGSAVITTDSYNDVDWTQAVEGRLEYHLSGYGPNIAATLITSTATAQQHTLSSQTYNYSRRRLKR